MKGGVFNRPGITDAFLADAGCHHVGADECAKRYGFRAEGIAIPFRHANGSPITDNDRPFTRVRLYHATDEQKYHQRPGSGVHIYIPPTFARSTKGSRLILVEGEFKALALVEAGYTVSGW